jgi:hypothetical protein
MTRDCRLRLYLVQIVGAVVGMAVPLLACWMLWSAATTGYLPLLLAGEIGAALLIALAVLGCWVWGQGCELG